MSTEHINAAEDSNMADCDEEKVVTMMDVLQEQEEFEEDANAVLGASDDTNCTYPKGYIKRQAVYACLTCCSDAKNDSSKRAGVCLACSLNCHENHEVIELYTRRNFRCDCGNPKFNLNPCQFTPNKTDLNEDNKYNQNFIGIYCTCHRPYPDPEAVTDDEMIQCTICEDWLHATHLEATLPSSDQYSEMICKACMKTNEFLNDYSCFAVNVDVDITLDEALNIKSDINETKEQLDNGLVGYTPTIQTTDNIENSSTKMDTSEYNNNKCKVSLSNNEKQESLAAIDEININVNNITSNFDVEKLDKDNIALKDLTNTISTADSEQLNNVKETDMVIAPKPEQTDLKSLSNKTETSANYLENKDMKLEDQLNQNMDGKDTDRNKHIEPTKACNNVCMTSKIIDSNQSTVTQEQPMEEMEVEIEHLVQPKDVDIGLITALSNIEKNLNMAKEDIKKNAKYQTTELIESTDITIGKLENIDSGSKTDDQPARIEAIETTSTVSLEPSELNIGKDVTINEVEINESTHKMKNESEQTIEIVNDKKDISESINAGTNMDTSESSLREDGLESNTESLSINLDLITNETEKRNVLESSELVTKTEGTLNNVEENDSGLKNEDQPTHKMNEHTNKDISNSSKVDSTNTTSNIVEDDQAFMNNLKEDDDQSDTLEKATRELLELTSDMVGESEEDSLLDCNNRININKLDTSESGTHIPVTTDSNESTEIEVNDVKSRNDALQSKESCDDGLPKNVNKRKCDEQNEVKEPKKARLDEKKCTRPKVSKQNLKGASFWTSDFRQKLCTCNECLTLYNDLRILFLLDPEDTVTAYETLGKEKINGTSSTQYEKGLEALSSLDRVQQINALTEYNILRDKLLDFLKSFKERKVIVKEEDIRAFFAGMKPKREPDGVYFCK